MVKQLVADISQFGRELRETREKLGLTQAEVAAAVGVDPQTISRWERDERRPSAEDYIKVSDYMAAEITKYVDGLDRTVSRGTIGSSTSAGPAFLLDASVLLASRAFQRHAARMGASDRELDYIEWVLDGPESVRMVALGDDGKPRSADEQAEELENQIEGLMTWLDRRVASRRAGQGTDLPGAGVSSAKMASTEMQIDSQRGETQQPPSDSSAAEIPRSADRTGRLRRDRRDTGT